MLPLNVYLPHFKTAYPQTDLEEERIKQKIADRTRKEKCRIYLIRLILNLFVIAVLACCFYSIYVATIFSQKAQRNDTKVMKCFSLLESKPSLSLFSLFFYFSIQETPIKLETVQIYFISLTLLSYSSG